MTALSTDEKRIPREYAGQNKVNGYGSVVVVSAQELYVKLSTSRKVVERALVVLAEHKAFVGLMADELIALSEKVQSGVELTYQEFMRVRAELRREVYVVKLVQIALQKAQRAHPLAPQRTVEQVAESKREQTRRNRNRKKLSAVDMMHWYWNNREALRQMWLFLDSFPQGWQERDILPWTQCLAPGRAGMPYSELQSKLIITALKAGWKPGVTVWNGEMVEEELDEQGTL